MSLAVRCCADPELLWFLIPSKGESSSSSSSHRYTTTAMERRTARRGALHRKGSMQRRAAATMGTSSQRGQGYSSPSTSPGYFSVELVLVFLCVVASLVFLPLLLPPLSPPPFLLLLVPVGLLAVLVALAFVPLDAHCNLVGSSRL